jgi:microcystin degradation protein MlrC
MLGGGMPQPSDGVHLPLHGAAHGTVDGVGGLVRRRRPMLRIQKVVVLLEEPIAE